MAREFVDPFGARELEPLGNLQNRGYMQEQYLTTFSTYFVTSYNSTSVVGYPNNYNPPVDPQYTREPEIYIDKPRNIET